VLHHARRQGVHRHAELLKSAIMPRSTPANAPVLRTIVCIYCRKPQQVGSTAMSLPCRFCHKALNVEDVVITGYAAKRVIETCGSITIEPKGDVTVNLLTCAGLVVVGKLKGNVISLGPVSIGATAIVRGDVTAPALHIASGARLEGRYVVSGVMLSEVAPAAARKSKPAR
jgi:hypothetical protein